MLKMVCVISMIEGVGLRAQHVTSQTADLENVSSSGDPRRPYPTDLEMRSGMLGLMANLPTNGVNGHLPGDALAAGRLPGESPDRCVNTQMGLMSLMFCGVCVLRHLDASLPLAVLGHLCGDAASSPRH